MIGKYLDISTGHVKDENRILFLETNIHEYIGDNLSELSWFGFPYDTGTFISVCTEDCSKDEVIEQLKAEGMEEIADILVYCLENDIKVIRFDANGEEMDDFPIFEWKTQEEVDEEEFAKNPPVDERPEWLSDEDHDHIIYLLKVGKKLAATKVVVDRSKEAGAGLWHPLRWGKMYVENLQEKWDITWTK